MTSIAPGKTRSWAPAALSLCTVLPSLGTSIANVALPDIATALDASFDQVQWVVIAYVLAVTTVVVGAGRLGDLVGRRRLLLAGTAVFTLATLLCGLAPDLPLLVAARAVQGIGAAAMMALTMALVGETVAPDRTGRVMGLLGTMSAIGTALGPTLGGVLVAGFGWRAIFLVGVPLGVVALVLVVRAVPASAPAAGPRRFDTAGTALLAVTLGAYALAMTVDGGLVALVVAAVGLVLFVVVERRVPVPLLSLSLLRDPALAASLTTSALVSTVMMTTLVVGPFHLARALGLAPVLVGLVMSAGPVVAALTGIPAGRATDRFGTGTTVVVGLGGVIAGTAALALTPASAGVLGYVLPLVVVTAGYALFQAANNTSVMKDVTAGRRGLVSGMLNLSRNLGLITGASVMGAVFAAVAGDVTAAGAAEVTRATHWTFAIASVGVAVGLAVVVWVRVRSRRR
ncbi:MFS transporter [Actinosynnema sp. NPDC047251]|uniref:Permease, MFS-type n=1 Tax=Saccharothrix espanaensis (strain ATCC 51144 / DSM 44229 / JCM 9112 / NBRC 15066 / NRRL 15764) TaxID=1179773 RepID=K0JSU3_SACES|nr:MFS transporter [Saccharothrix espanaensis]CCH30805.1 Permease, MFS-type [Saccharothrix espanaensis DSM 44229]